MIFAVAWMAVFVVIIVVAFVIMSQRRDNAWKQLSSEVGGEFVPGGAFRPSKVQAQIERWTVILDTYSVPSGDSNTTYTRLRSSLQNKDGLQFTLFREGLVGKLDKALGAQDIEIGVPDFDHDFVIQGNDESKVRALLADAKIRQMIQGQRSIRLGLKGDELLFEAQGVIRDVPRLKALFGLFAELLKQVGA